MSPTSHRETFTTGDSNFAFPTGVLHAAPVLLAVLDVAISLSGPSVFRQFEEHRPGTGMSVALMVLCLLLTLPALTSETLSRAKRMTALVISVILPLALFDETHQIHEALGKMAQHRITWLPFSVLHYTDDVIVLVTTMSAGGILYLCLRKVEYGRRLSPYLWVVLAVGMGQGLLDLCGHGQYLWQHVWPGITMRRLYSPLEMEGFYEESFKLWTEWFTVLFLLRLFHGQRGALGWTACVFVGTMLAPLGLWQVSPDPVGVPLVVVGGGLRYFRNFHLLALISWLWLGWTVLTWRLFKGDATRRTYAGLFFLCPFPLLLPRLMDPTTFYGLWECGVDALRPWLPFLESHVLAVIVAPAVLVPGILFGLAAARAWRTLPGTGATLALLALAIGVSAHPSLAFGLLNPVEAGGLILPISLLSLAKQRQHGPALFQGGLLVSLLLIHTPLWQILVLTAGLTVWLQHGPNPASGWSRRFWLALLGLHFVAATAFLVAAPPVFMRNLRFRSGPYYSVPLSVHYERTRWGIRP